MKKEKESMSKTQVIVNMLANIVSYSASIVISFILTPFLINALGKETYSFFPIANTIVSYMSVLANAMNAMASRFVAINIVKNDEMEANKYFSSATIANILMALILVVPMTIIVVFMDKFMEIPINSIAAIKGLFSLVFASTLVSIITSVLGIATFAKNRIDLRSLRELITSVLRLVLFFVFYKFLKPSIIYVGLVALIVAVVNAIFQYNYTKILLPEIKWSKEYVSVNHTKELLTSSCWSAINSLGNIMLVGMSLIFSNIIYGASEAGVYSIVNTVPQFINGVISMLIGVFYPVITYKYAKGDKTGLINEIQNTQKIVGTIGCAVLSVFSALSTEFFILWVPGENAQYLSLLSFVVVIPHFIISCMWTLTNVNVVMNKVRIPALITLFCGCANIICVCFVGYFFETELIILPIISSLLQVVWIGFLIPQYVSKNLQIKWFTFYPTLIKALILSCIIMCGILKVKQYFILNSWIKLLIFGGACGIVALLILSFSMFGITICNGFFRELKKIFSKFKI